MITVQSFTIEYFQKDHETAKIDRLIVLINELKQQDYDTLAIMKDERGMPTIIIHKER